MRGGQSDREPRRERSSGRRSRPVRAACAALCTATLGAVQAASEEMLCTPASFATREVTRVDGAAQGDPRETRRECPPAGSAAQLGCDAFVVRLSEARATPAAYVFSSARSRGTLEVVQELRIEKASGRFEQRVTTETLQFTSTETTLGSCRDKRG